MIFIGFDDRTYYCILESKNGSSPRMFCTILFIIIPLICIIGCYSAIYLKVRKGQKVLLSLLGSNSGTDNIRKNIEETDSQLFRMIMVISACFSIFIVPKLVLKIITVFITSELVNVEHALIVLLSANSIVNPFVYFFTNKNFREALIQLLPTKLRNVMIKGQSVERTQDQKLCGSQTQGLQVQGTQWQFWICFFMNDYLIAEIYDWYW